MCDVYISNCFFLFSGQLYSSAWASASCLHAVHLSVITTVGTRLDVNVSLAGQSRLVPLAVVGANSLIYLLKHKLAA